MAALLQSLGMTQNDLNSLRESVNTGTTNAPTAAPPTATAAPVPSGSSNGGEEMKMVDLSELQKKLGLDSKPNESKSQSSSTPAATTTTQVQIPVASSNSNQSNRNAATSNPNSPAPNNPAPTYNITQNNPTASGSSYDFLGQFNSMLTANSLSSGVIPLNAPISTTPTSSALPGFMDLTNLQEQLGLIPKPTVVNTTATAQQRANTTANTTKTQPADGKASVNTTSQNASSGTYAPSVQQTSSNLASSQNTNNSVVAPTANTNVPAQPTSTNPVVAIPNRTNNNVPANSTAVTQQ